MTPAQIEEQRQFKKIVESLTAELSRLDNLALHFEKGPDVPIEERRKVLRLQQELKQMEEVD